AEMARAFRHLEALVFEEIRRTNVTGQAVQVFRIGVADRHAHDYESVVAVKAEEAGRPAPAVNAPRFALGHSRGAGASQLALAALAMLCRDYLAEIEGQPSDTNKRHDDRMVNHGK